MLTSNDVMHLFSRWSCLVGLLVFPIAGCSDLSDADGAGGTGGTGDARGVGGSGGTGGCSADSADPVTTFFETTEWGGDGPGAPLGGVRICEVGTSNCETSNDEGRAALVFPGCQEVAWTLEKEGYDPAAGADVTDDTFSREPIPWSLRTVEEIQGWTDDLGTPYPWTSVYLRALPRIAGVTYDLVGATGAGYYMDEAGQPTVDVAATTSWGDGGFVELAPGEVEVEFGGTATDCVASIAWTSERPNAIRLPVIEGFYTYGSMRCSE